MTVPLISPGKSIPELGICAPMLAKHIPGVAMWVSAFTAEREGKQIRVSHSVSSGEHAGIVLRIGRARAGKLVGWDKDSLIGEAKAAHISKAK